ncbi:MAG: serine/threonine protein kinase [Colwellia sp.]
MLANKIDLFEYYCDIADLSEMKQVEYIAQLRCKDIEIANQLEALIKTNSELTQAFTDSVLDLTDGNQFAQVGDTLTNYQLIQSLGYGGMGQVFKAQRNDGKIEQTVAIKCLHPLFEQYQSGKLLIQEAQALANLSHPNIASIYDIAETDSGNTYIVMEYIEGETLDVYLHKNTLSVGQKLKLFLQISDAVLEAHNHQIIHADIKPSNILINASGQVKLIDFGVMQLTEDLNNNAPKFVTAYVGAMTVNYASPEQLNGAKATIASDIYGLGSLLYFMLSGSTPFERIDDTLTHKIEYINTQAPIDCVINGDVKFKADLIAIINKALSKLPQERYRTVTDFINDINAFQSYKKISISTNNWFHNGVKLIYKYRIINSIVASAFLILLIVAIQINIKNEQLIAERKLLENINQEYKKTFTKHHQSIADKDGNSEVIYLPDPSKVEEKQYIEVMFLMFDDYYHQKNKPAYSLVINTLVKWLSTQSNIEPLDIHLASIRQLISDQKDNVNDDGFVQHFDAILAIEEPLTSEVLSIFHLKDYSAKLINQKIIPLFNRLENELVKSDLSITELFLLHQAGATTYHESNFELSSRHYEKAFKLAKNNTSEVKLWLYIDLIYNYFFLIMDWEGTQHKQLMSLKKELYLRVNSMGDEKMILSKIHLLLQLEMNYSMGNAEKILQDYNITYESSLLNASISNIPLIQFHSKYFEVLGEYDKAIMLADKVLELKDANTGNDYHFSLLNLAFAYFKAGDMVNAMSLVEEKILPFSAEHDTADFYGFYQVKFCLQLSLYENSERLKNLCFDGFNNMKNTLGVDNHWSRYGSAAVIAWYTLQAPDKEEFYYVDLLTSHYQNFNSIEKISTGLILEKYYISRKLTEKANYYQVQVNNTIDNYYDSVDTIVRYYHQITAAEIDLLQNDKTNAITKLNKINEKICGLNEKNPYKIKYIALQHSLNQSACTQ